ncbi:fused response regulator/phosphatase [Catellatospora sp. KI3]|uniref:PP2C family protein-serine/threonine phosphatase n=1 Tax=Catellatospora sp. KI3 TaxID=3041620 RepID=UPI0024821A89|nr:fused response regulator/phosphatase [Catellatospora sp. KI3]MDI1461403.1 fused response regulator/phosphatase [Catellatospora sp. KI3]
MFTAPPAPVQPRGPARLARLRVLLIEDDEGDAFLVGELLDEQQAAIQLTVASSLNEARQLFDATDCILLDLGLPDAQGMEGLRRVLAEAPGVAVCVLTGQQDAHVGISAVAEGAQDYLVKGQVDGALLERSVQYAVERKHAEVSAGRLREVELRQAESARLERGLLPQPLMSSDRLAVHTFYRPGRHEALLGGDFFDVVQTSPRHVHAVIGDVSGHDVDGAALGVELRVAWRALTLAGVAPEPTLAAMEQVLVSERSHPGTFATMAVLRIDLDTGRAACWLAGHPPPLLLADGSVAPVDVPYGMLLGLGDAPRTGTEFDLPAGPWSLLLFTDGLVEGRTGDGPERLGYDRLDELCRARLAAGVPMSALPSALVEAAEALNGGPLADDVAIVLLNKETAS